MARRPSTPRRPRANPGEFDNGGLPSTDELSPIALLKDFVTEINVKGDTTAIFNTDAPTNVTVWTHEKNFKVKPITSDDEFTFKGVKLGARQQMIFEFSPLDPTKYIHIEIDESKAFAVFPDFQVAVLEVFRPAGGTPPLDDHRLGRSPPLGHTFEELKKTWIALTKLRRQGEIKTVVEEKAATLLDSYGDNPLFGAF